MTKIEESEMGMIAKTVSFLQKNQDKFKGYERLITEINTLSGLRLVLTSMVAKQSEVTKGITVNKKLAFANLANLVVKIAAKASVWANDTNDQALAAVFKVSFSSFQYQPKAKQLVQAQGMVDVLTANAPALLGYNISAADITSIADSISNCEEHAIAPGAASNSKKAATAAIKNLLVTINGSLAIIDKLISSEYAEDDPDFVNEYLNNRKVDGRGVRHSGLSVTFTDAATGKAIENAVVDVAALGKTAISNFNGLAEIPTMKTGSYHILFSATGYAPQTLDVTVTRRKTVELAIAMVAS